MPGLLFGWLPTRLPNTRLPNTRDGQRSLQRNATPAWWWSTAPHSASARKNQRCFMKPEPCR